MTAPSQPRPLTARHATLEDLAALLRDQQARKVDVVAPPPRSAPRAACLVVDGTEPVLAADGVTMTDGHVHADRRVRSGDRGQARHPCRLPAAGCASSSPALYDANVNGWLERDDRKFLLRCLRGDDGGTGVARAFLSDGYKIIDNLDVLMAVLDGVRRGRAPGAGATGVT